jgi:hypothetical protein
VIDAKVMSGSNVGCRLRGWFREGASRVNAR